MKTSIALFILSICSSNIVFGQNSTDANKIALWNENIPAATGTNEKDTPYLIPYYPDPGKATGSAIVVCPGGGYGHLAMDHEGQQVGRWLQDIGIAAFILKYRLPVDGYRHPIPLMDAQRAIRLVRSRAADLKIDTDRIGIMGFSAGGHLASTVGTHFVESATITGYAPDAVDMYSARPDFMVLMYPVISMQNEFTHAGSKGNLLGPNPSQELVELLSNERQVTAQTPPTFLVHADDDRSVPPENTTRFYEALREANVSAEMHLFAKGGHGFGMRQEVGPAHYWTKLCENWLKQFQLPVEKKGSSASDSAD